jgi:hypothetical protein
MQFLSHDVLCNVMQCYRVYRTTWHGEVCIGLFKIYFCKFINESGVQEP